MWLATSHAAASYFLRRVGDIISDGRFLINTVVEAAAEATPITVNWTAGLKK